MTRLFTIHLRSRYGEKVAEVLVTTEFLAVLTTIREQYGRVSLRPTKQGISLYVDNWKV